MALEPLLGQATIDRGLLDELFRSFHSLKGLSAMVGFNEAEQLAQSRKHSLSAIRKNQVRLEVTGLETLVSGVATLEQIIAAAGIRPMSPISLPWWHRWLPCCPRAGLSRSGANSHFGHDFQQVAEDSRCGRCGKSAGRRQGWLVTFTPSSALVKQGLRQLRRRKLQALVS